ncbi:MAG: amidohydrolase family protein [Dissulfurimicrobium sp.]|uniref:amidohydrolase family protein n=1 Tax=Dissulfurimicrobium TaxID=1769732 RepID=UPI003C71081A
MKRLDNRETLRIHRARWVVPVSCPPISNGAVVTFGGKIIEVGEINKIALRFHGTILDHGDVILCPRLINVHSHMELAPLKYRLEPSGSFTGWIRAVIKARSNINADEFRPAVEAAINEMTSGGIVAVGDIGNTELIPEIVLQNMGPGIRGIFFKEIICQQNDPRPLVNDWISFTAMTSGCFHFTVAAHAPYTVSPQAIKVIKSISRLRKRPFSIHVAESSDEIEFLAGGNGPLRELLEERGCWLPFYDIPKASPVSYLSSLNVLDKDTICVHCVHLSDDDIDILARGGATACLCPRSNFFLGVGIPPAEKLVKAGVPIVLGTDSLASNDRLSIFSEMASLARIAPGLSTEIIFKAATHGGARALGMGEDLGALSEGKIAVFLAVNAPNIIESDIYDFLTMGCEGPEVRCHLING